MNEKSLVNNPIYGFLPLDIEGIASLAELALDMRWSWNHAADEVWQALDPDLWRLTHNPWSVLQTVSHVQLRKMLANPAFSKKTAAIIKAKNDATSAPAWFQQNHADSPLTSVAYFSMEFMLSEALPIYSGGLGNVAGDQLKAASDLGIPVIGVGLLYQQGYFRQVIDRDGTQQAIFPYNDPGQLPITPLRQANGEWLRFEIVMPGYSVWVRTWQVQVGRVKLYLLDSNLLLNNPERLLRILTNPERPVHLILAGKAHPADLAGQALIKEWINFINRPEARSHVIFLSDYDMLLAEHLVQGVDVWLNTPQRPWEACGTSGMKVLVNGGINISELDGWWTEAYTPELGWAIGDGLEHSDDPALDIEEANKLYDLLESEVIPEFYTRDEKGIPVSWVNRMRESMAKLTPRFSANRTVREYTEQHYLPSAAAYLERSADKGAFGRQIINWQHGIDQKWSLLHYGDVKVETDATDHNFEADVYLNELNSNDVRVEIYADAIDGSRTVKQEMLCVRQLPGVPDCYLYRAKVSSTRPATDYTLRKIPYYPGVSVPLEAVNILWQK